MSKSKMKTIIILGLSFLLITSLVWTKDEITPEQKKMYYSYLKFASLVKGASIQPHWMADGNSFWYAEGAPDKTVIYRVDAKANTKELLFDTERLHQALIPVLGHEPPYKGLPFEKFTFVDGEKAIKFTVEGREFICQLDTYKITSVPLLSREEKNRMVPRVVREGWYASSPDVMETLSPDRRWFLGVKNYNLYLRSTYDGRSEPLTSDGIKDYEWVMDGAQWSPNSFYLATMKVDNRKVLRIPVVHWLKTNEEVEWIPYVKAGGPMPQPEIFIVDILSKNRIRVDTGNEPDKHFNIVGWRSDSSELIITRAHREWKKLELIAADLKNGSTRVILTETAQTFIGGLAKTHIPFFLEDGKKFIWLSERTGWAHLYLYDMKGNLIKQLTKGLFPVVKVVAVDEKEGWVYFTAHAEKRVYDTHLYRVNMEGDGFTRLTEFSGQHDIQFSPSREFYLDTHSTIDRRPAVELRKADGTLLQIISKANIDALEKIKWSPPEEFVVKAADKKTDLNGVLYKPYNFDSNKKYPVIDHIYNGPYRTQVPRAFTDGRGVWPQALAQLGYIVFLVDGRGTTERGKEFQDVVYRNFGRNEIPDHVAALNELASERPYMDLNRVGIFGGSWGGYMTIRALLLAPDVYHVGVSIYPVVDLYDHNANAIEYYMGLPQNNREAYEYASSIRLADKLKGNLLIMHGTSDVNATFSATMKMAEAFIRASTPIDLAVLPELDHSLSGKSGTYILEAVRRYFQKHL